MNWHKDLNELERLRNLVPQCYQYFFESNLTIDGFDSYVNSKGEKVINKGKDYDRYVSYVGNSRLPNIEQIVVDDSYIKRSKCVGSCKDLDDRFEILALFKRKHDSRCTIPVYIGLAIREVDKWVVRFENRVLTHSPLYNLVPKPSYSVVKFELIGSYNGVEWCKIEEFFEDTDWLNDEQEMERLRNLVPYCYRYLFNTNYITQRIYDNGKVLKLLSPIDFVYYKLDERVPELNKIIDLDNSFEYPIDMQLYYSRFYDPALDKLESEKLEYRKSRDLKPRIKSGIARKVDKTWFVEYKGSLYKPMNDYKFNNWHETLEDDYVVDFEIVEPGRP